MKRCPECDSSYADTDQFCDRDGTPLVADYSQSNSELSDERQALGVEVPLYPVSRGNTLQENWGVIAILAFTVFALGVVLIVVYQRGTFKTSQDNTNTATAGDSGAARQIVPPPLRPSPTTSESPSPEPSPSPSPVPTPGSQTEPTRLPLSSSPVSTGGSDKSKPGPVTIRLTNGTAVEADEVWETAEGIWYRRRGVVTLLDREQVQAIEKPSPPAPSPEATATKQ